MKSEMKLLFWIIVLLIICILGLLVPPNLWLPFAEYFPDWFTMEPVIMQIARLGPLIAVGIILWGLAILVKKWW